jgi:hypothetical protein
MTEFHYVLSGSSYIPPIWLVMKCGAGGDCAIFVAQFADVITKEYFLLRYFKTMCAGPSGNQTTTSRTADGRCLANRMEITGKNQGIFRSRAILCHRNRRHTL